MWWLNRLELQRRWTLGVQCWQLLMGSMADGTTQRVLITLTSCRRYCRDLTWSLLFVMNTTWIVTWWAACFCWQISLTLILHTPRVEPQCWNNLLPFVCLLHLFISVTLCTAYYMLYYCNMVGLKSDLDDHLRPSVLWLCWLVRLTCKNCY